MALIKRSSCEDSVDRFNHTWMVIFLLIVAAVTFFVPFGLPHDGHPAPGGAEALTKYSSNCWSPGQFTNNMVEYTNAACTAAFARAQSTNPPVDNDNGQILATVSRMPSGIDVQTMDQNASETHTVQQTDAGAYDFILEYTPLFLFVSAVVFKFVHALFVLFVSWYGVNLGSLAVTWRSLLTDAERGDQPKQKFLQDLSRKLKTSRWLTFGYLVYKLTICTLCVIFEVVIYYSMMPGLVSLDGHTHSRDLHDVVQPRSESVKRMCDLSVVNNGKTQSYTVQCMFTSAAVQSDDHSRMVQFYRPFYTALLFTFVILTLVNAINWTLWAVKLCRNQSSKRPDESLSLDARLLVCLVAEHGDSTASEKLEEGLISVQKGSDSNFELNKESEDL